MLLMIDNYDSFTYNLYQYLSELGAEVEVARNDKISLEDIQGMSPDGIIISPGPGTPLEAGISNDVIRHFGPKTPTLGVCLGHHAAKGGRAAKGELTLTRVQETLPPMDSPANVKLALETIRAWALAGMIPGSVLNGVVRIHQDWIAAHDSQMDRQLLRDAEERIQELEDQLRRASVRRVS